MNFFKKIFLVLYFSLLSVLLFLICTISSIIKMRNDYGNLSQVTKIWLILIKFFFNVTKENVAKIKLNENISKKLKKDYISINMDNVNLFELFMISYYSLYFGFIIYVIMVSLIGILTYKAVFVSAVSTNVEKKPVKEKIVYEKSNSDLNKDTYCPCFTLLDIDKEIINTTLNTIIFDEDSTMVKYSKSNRINDKEIAKGVKEVPLSFSFDKYKKKYKINTQDGYDFKVNELQGFVFSYDLSSLYFIKKGELYRIAKKY